MRDKTVLELFSAMRYQASRNKGCTMAHCDRCHTHGARNGGICAWCIADQIDAVTGTTDGAEYLDLLVKMREITDEYD